MATDPANIILTYDQDLLGTVTFHMRITTPNQADRDDIMEAASRISDRLGIITNRNMIPVAAMPPSKVKK